LRVLGDGRLSSPSRTGRARLPPCLRPLPPRGGGSDRSNARDLGDQLRGHRRRRRPSRPRSHSIGRRASVSPSDPSAASRAPRASIARNVYAAIATGPPSRSSRRSMATSSSRSRWARTPTDWPTSRSRADQPGATTGCTASRTRSKPLDSRTSWPVAGRSRASCSHSKWPRGRREHKRCVEDALEPICATQRSRTAIRVHDGPVGERGPPRRP
jgi:hypothetical protein